MAESEQQTEAQQNMDVEENGAVGHDMRVRNTQMQDADYQSYIMRDWILVAAGLERLFFSIYALAFAIITSVYV